MVVHLIVVVIYCTSYICCIVVIFLVASMILVLNWAYSSCSSASFFVRTWFPHRPMQCHEDAVKRIVRYLIRTKDEGLYFGSKTDF